MEKQSPRFNFLRFDHIFKEHILVKSWYVPVHVHSNSFSEGTALF